MDEKRAVASERGSYGYRRLTALLKRELTAEGRPPNHKKVDRLMRGHQLLLRRQLRNSLLERGAAMHPGVIAARYPPEVKGLCA